MDAVPMPPGAPPSDVALGLGGAAAAVLIAAIAWGLLRRYGGPATWRWRVPGFSPPRHPPLLAIPPVERSASAATPRDVSLLFKAAEIGAAGASPLSSSLSDPRSPGATPLRVATLSAADVPPLLSGAPFSLASSLVGFRSAGAGRPTAATAAAAARAPGERRPHERGSRLVFRLEHAAL